MTKKKTFIAKYIIKLYSFGCSKSFANADNADDDLPEYIKFSKRLSTQY